MTVSKTLLGIALLIAIVVVAKTKEAPLILGVLVVAGIAFTVFKPIFAGL